MLKKFCPKCGKETEKLYNNLCSDCFLEKKSSDNRLLKSIIARRCNACGKYYVGNEQFRTLSEAVEEEISGLFKSSNIVSINFRIDERRSKVYLTIISRFDGLEKEEARELNLIIKSIVCKYCAMKNSGYYNTILQLRLPKELMESIVDEILKQLSFANQFDSQAFVSKIEKKKEGLDLYIGSKKAANELVAALKRELGVKTKFSRKLAGKSKGKNIYRDTILITIKMVF